MHAQTSQITKPVDSRNTSSATVMYSPSHHHCINVPMINYATNESCCSQGPMQSERRSKG